MWLWAQPAFAGDTGQGPSVDEARCPPPETQLCGSQHPTSLWDGVPRHAGLHSLSGEVPSLGQVCTDEPQPRRTEKSQTGGFQNRQTEERRLGRSPGRAAPAAWTAAERLSTIILL